MLISWRRPCHPARPARSQVMMLGLKSLPSSHLWCNGAARSQHMGPNSLWTCALTAATLCFFAPTGKAGTQVYKCVKDGQIVLTDKPCAGPDTGASAANPVATVPSSSIPSPIGKWSGQIQYHGVENGQTMLAAQTVAGLSAEFTAEGKVTGTSPENGCEVLGVWSAGSTSTLFWIDATLNGCQFAAMMIAFTEASFWLSRTAPAKFSFLL